jgi:mannose-6-phosphate isomerase-like protein (cupin superfamily)
MLKTRWKKCGLILIAVAVTVAIARTQQPAAPSVTYVEAAKVSELFAKPGPLANGTDFAASIARRTAAGQVEVHVKETDIFYIVDGSATFVTGGTIVGGRESRPNQMLGTDISGGQTQQLKKGDFISIPAGIPHWFKEVPASGVTYYMVKVLKP